VRYSSISPSAKLLYGEITALCNERGYCWANNRYFANLYDVETETASRWIAELVEGGFIKSDVSQADGNKRKLTLKGIDKKINTSIKKAQEGLEEKVKHNNTSNNTYKQSFATSVAWSLEKALSDLEADSKPAHLGVIAMYLRERNTQFENQAQLNQAIKRHARPASQIAHFSRDKIWSAVEKAKKTTPEWTLETVLKMLTK
jgi:hypothetical protein